MGLSQGKLFEYDPGRLAERLEMRDRRIIPQGPSSVHDIANEVG